MILELKDICKDYLQGKMVIPVLKHIDFQMEQGEYVAHYRTFPVPVRRR